MYLVCNLLWVYFWQKWCNKYMKKLRKCSLFFFVKCIMFKYSMESLHTVVGVNSYSQSRSSKICRPSLYLKKRNSKDIDCFLFDKDMELFQHLPYKIHKPEKPRAMLTGSMQRNHPTSSIRFADRNIRVLI